MTGRVRSHWAWWLLAYARLGLGLVGIVVPGLPTVPFVLLAAFAAARGSQRLHRRLLAHAQFGPMIRDWQAHGTVSRRAKVLAITMMAACAVLMFLTAPRWWMLGAHDIASPAANSARISASRWRRRVSKRCAVSRELMTRLRRRSIVTEAHATFCLANSDDSMAPPTVRPQAEPGNEKP